MCGKGAIDEPPLALGNYDKNSMFLFGKVKINKTKIHLPFGTERICNIF